MEKTIKEIAKNKLGIKTLRTRNRDSLDFCDLSVWCIKEALELAYIAGQEASRKMKKWIAYNMASDTDNLSKQFNTKKEAEKYVMSFNCEMCKKDGLGSACASEWLVLLTKDFLKSETMDDIFMASGWKKIKKELNKQKKK